MIERAAVFPDGFPSDVRLWRVGLLSASALGLVLRFFAIGGQSLWYDESFTERCIRASYGELALGSTRDNGNPPLYWLLAKVWLGLWGDSEAALRSLPALLGALTVPLLGILGRRLLGVYPGLMVAFLLAISPMAIELSNEARTYALVGLLAVVNNLLFVVWIDKSRLRDLSLYSITMALAWYSHYFAFALPLSHATVLAFLPRARRRSFGWLIAMVGAGLLWAPWLRPFTGQLLTPGNLSRMGDGWRLQFMATPLVFGFGRTLAWRESRAYTLALSSAASFIAFWMPAAYGLIRLKSRPAVAVLLGTWALLPIAGPLVVALTLTPIYATRYAYIGLPAFLILTAFGLCELRPWCRKWAILLILAPTLVSLYRYAALPLKDDWRSASAAILGGYGGSEAVMSDPDIEATPFRYYARRPGRRMPDSVVGIVQGPIASPTIIGIDFQAVVKGDRRERDITSQILKRPGIWLGLRHPGTSAERYMRFFLDNGFDLDARLNFHQLDILHFVKHSNPSH